MGWTINLGKSHESTPIWEKSGQVGANEDDLRTRKEPMQGPMKMISAKEKLENVIFITSEINLLSTTYIFVEKFLLNFVRHIVPPEICQLKTF